MKHVLSGIALAAVLALAIPASAQAPNSSNPPNAPTAAKAAQTKPHAAPKAGHARAMPRKQMMKHAAMKRPHARHHAAHMKPMHRMTTARLGRTPSDNVANRLNGQELQRLSGSSMPPANYPPQQPGNAPAPAYQGR